MTEEIKLLLEKVQEELDTLEGEDLAQFAKGYEHRSLDSVVEWWYLPDSLKEGAISQLAAIIRDFKDTLWTKAEKYLKSEKN